MLQVTGDTRWYNRSTLRRLSCSPGALAECQSDRIMSCWVPLQLIKSASCGKISHDHCRPWCPFWTDLMLATIPLVCSQYSRQNLDKAKPEQHKRFRRQLNITKHMYIFIYICGGCKITFQFKHVFFSELENGVQDKSFATYTKKTRTAPHSAKGPWNKSFFAWFCPTKI